MKNWQIEVMNHDVDSMWGADAAAEWERINAPDPDPYENILKAAAKDMIPAINQLRKAIEELLGATAYLYETPMLAKVDSYIESLEDIEIDLKMMKERWERGERE